MSKIILKPSNNKELRIKAIFFRFLKDSDLYHLYITNFKVINFDSIYEPLYSNKPISNGQWFIMSAFQWNKTKEGYDFWKKRHELWIKYLDLSKENY